MPGPRVALDELLRRVLASDRSDLWTIVVGTVVAVPSPGWVDVQPQVRRALPDVDEPETLLADPLPMPVVPNIRVCYLVVAGGISIVFPCEVGSVGLLLIETRNSDLYLANGQIDPQHVGDARLHHPANAKFLPCLSLDTDLPTIEASTLTLSAPTVKLGDSTASDFAALSSKVDANFAELASVLATGLTAPNGGGPVTGGAAFTPEPTACTKVKIK